jgi:hypothetical protein
MQSKQKIIFTPEEKTVKLNKVMVEVRKKVLRYEIAKNTGTLKKAN